MAIVTLRLSDVKSEAASRPKGCPSCGSAVLQGWGWVSKPVRDPQMREVKVRRYRCDSCRRSFRHYPEGINRADQSQRSMQLAAICWTLGLSLRAVSGILGVFSLPLAHMTVWRDVQGMAERLRRRQPGAVRVLGVDGFYGRLRGWRYGAVVAVDLGSGQPVAIAEVAEQDSQAVVRWLKPLVEALGVEVIVRN